MIDTHAHLDGCDEPAAFLVERARAVGVSRIVTIGTGIPSCHAALAIAAAEQGVFAALGIDPHQAGGPEGARVDELVELLDHPRAVAVGETGLDYFHDLAPRPVQRELFDRQLEIASAAGLPVVIHTRDADADTAAALAGFPGTVILHCFSAPALLDVAVERGYYVSFAGNVTYPKAAELREAAAVVPADRILAETDSPYLAPQPLRGKRNEPANVLHTLAVLAEARGEDVAAARAGDRPKRNRGLRAPGPVSGPQPKKSLGQHFLVDDNILGVIARLAELGPADVALEIGPGLGALTRILAEQCAHVHAVELDHRLEPHLRDVAAAPNVTLHWGDALRLDLASFDPAPTKLVANLPYNVATPIVAESLDGLPSIEQLVRDGAARGRRPLLRRPVDEGVRSRLGPDPARHDAHGIPSRRALRLSAAAQRRLGARRVPAHDRSRPTSPGSGRSSKAHSPIDARRSPTPSSSRE